MGKAARTARRLSGALCAMVSAASALVFIAVSFWGGFRIDFPGQTVSVTNPVIPLVMALALSAVYELLARRQRREDRMASPPPPAASGGETGFPRYGGWIILIATLLGVRFAYQTYEPFLMGKSSEFALMAWAPLMVAGAAVGAWRSSCCARRSPAAARVAWFPVLLWVLAPLAFPIHPVTTIACWIAAFVQPAFPHAGKPAKWRAGTVWAAVAVMTLLLLVLLVLLGTVGPGWAGKRAVATISDSLSRGGPLFFAVGLPVVIFTPSVFRQAAHRAAWLALPGFALAGTRGVWGIAGVVLLLPLGAVLLMAALADIDRRLEAAYMCFARNIIQLCLAGLIFGFIGSNLTRRVRGPVTVDAKPGISACQQHPVAAHGIAPL